MTFQVLLRLLGIRRGNQRDVMCGRCHPCHAAAGHADCDAQGMQPLTLCCSVTVSGNAPPPAGLAPSEVVIQCDMSETIDCNTIQVMPSCTTAHDLNLSQRKRSDSCLIICPGSRCSQAKRLDMHVCTSPLKGDFHRVPTHSSYHP